MSTASRPRLSVARLMVVIAIVGLILGGARWMQIIIERRSNALKHELEVKRYQTLMGLVDKPEVSLRIIPQEVLDSSVTSGRQPAHYVEFRLVRGNEPQDQGIRDYVIRHRDEFLAMCRDQGEFHERMRHKWSRAAWFPWTHVEPDGLGPPSYGGFEGAPWSGMY